MSGISKAIDQSKQVLANTNQELNKVQSTIQNTIKELGAVDLCLYFVH